MEEIKPRLDLDGKAVQDVTPNPKAIERKMREEAERTSLTADAAAPWSRKKVERELSRLEAQRSVGVIDGKVVRHSLNLHGADISGLDLSGLDLSNANMHGAKAVQTNFTGCRLVGTNLHDAELTGAVLDNVNAVEANLCGACLCGSKADKAHFMAANLSECCFEGNAGIDIIEKPLTTAEDKKARHMQSEGFRVNIVFDEKEQGNAKAVYIGATLDKANITGMSSVCRRRKK